MYFRQTFFAGRKNQLNVAVPPLRQNSEVHLMLVTVCRYDTITISPCSKTVSYGHTFCNPSPAMIKSTKNPQDLEITFLIKGSNISTKCILWIDNFMFAKKFNVSIGFFWNGYTQLLCNFIETFLTKQFCRIYFKF